MRVEEYSGTKDQWNTFIAENGGWANQSYEWGEFRTDRGWSPIRLIVKDDQTVYLQILVLTKPLPGGFSLLYAPEGPIVRKGDWKDAKNQAAFKEMLSGVKAHAKKHRAILLKIDPHVEAEGFPGDWLKRLGFHDSPEDIQPAYVAQVDLTKSEDEILAGMKQKGRYNIRYATKKGVTVTKGTSEQDLKDWYELTKASAQRQGITYRSFEYFKDFRKHFMVNSDLACFMIARYNGTPVSATLLMFMGSRADYLYGGSSDQDRNVFASYLIQWEGMKEAKRRGCTFYNLTGIAHADDPKNPWYGLRQFKLKFGPEEVALVGAWDLIYKSKTNFLFTKAERARRGFAKLIGKVRSR
ncbi:peptidoglycan bridge formation glycyltransferase FemA/FemB family protein [Patescibacteria group bacterium]|nr:peptidoglycan bridge formation glycyltransferase FemA/FemB family protein [Patescibacteria group bacterium]